MATLRLCAVVMLPDAGVTVTVGVTASAVTVTEAVPEALLYAAEPALSGVYLAVSVAEPAASDPAGTVMVAEPELSVVVDEVKLPLERTIEPVGVPSDPETATVTESAWAVVMLPDAGVTVTVGVVGFGLVPPPSWLPEPHAPTERANADKRRTRNGFADRFIEGSSLTC
jgi:hypothetical protein